MAADKDDLRDRIATVAARHGFALGAGTITTYVGAHATVYLLPEAALKVAKAGVEAGEAVRRDAAVAPVAGAAGVRVARLLAFDDSGDVFPAPYALFRRIPGNPLASPRAGRNRKGIAAARRAVGRDPALVHGRADADGAPALAARHRFARSPDIDPRPWAEAAVAAGHIGAADGTRPIGLLDRLAPAALAPVPLRWCHGDLHAANVRAGPPGPGYLALIDGAGSGWIDPAWDFSGLPSTAVPHVLAGDRGVAPLPADETAEARIVWCRLQRALFGLRNEPPGSAEGKKRAQRLLADAKRGGAGSAGSVSSPTRRIAPW